MMPVLHQRWTMADRVEARLQHGGQPMPLHCGACHPYGETAAAHAETLADGRTIYCDSGGPHTPHICAKCFPDDPAVGGST